LRQLAEAGSARSTDVLWLEECPFYWDEGLVRPLVTANGKVVLMCDSCSTVWCGPGDVESGRYSEPADPGWETNCGTHVRPGTTRWARAADVRRAGWTRFDWHENEEVG
jgi:hypothetical protein